MSFSYVQDIPDLLHALEGLNNIPEDTIQLSVDVGALYTNINREDGVEAVRKVLETRPDKTVPTDFIVKLLDLILHHNIFEFNGELYQQRIGCAIGTHCAPNLADIFMSFIDEEIMKRGHAGHAHQCSGNHSNQSILLLRVLPPRSARS